MDHTSENRTAGVTMEDIARINELYHKSKGEGLTSEEAEEQKKLRRAYIDSIKASIVGTMNNVDIVNEDGSVTNVGEEYEKNQKKAQFKRVK